MKNKKKVTQKKVFKKKVFKKKVFKKKVFKKKVFKKKRSQKKRSKKTTKNSKNKKFKKSLKNKKKKLIKNILKKNKTPPKNLLLKIIRLQDSLRLKIKSQINLNFFLGLERLIQSFFGKIDEKIQDYKILIEDEKRRKKIAEIEEAEINRLKELKKLKTDEELKTKIKEKALKEEIKLEKVRVKDIKIFLRQEQALVRKEQAEKQKQFLKQLQLEKQIEKFRIREVKELEQLEKVSLKEKRQNYAELQERIDKLKEKYRIIRDQKIRERVEALGVKISGDEDRETLLKKEKEYTIARQKIELSLESFYRSANSLVFQLNKRHITRHMSIFRCIDRRFETGEVFIKWDETEDNDWLILIYIKNNSPDEGIVIEDKSNPDKNLSHEFKSNEIFKASDLMVDSLTQLISRKRSKKE